MKLLRKSGGSHFFDSLTYYTTLRFARFKNGLKFPSFSSAYPTISILLFLYFHVYSSFSMSTIGREGSYSPLKS